jgi:hypothetical protein
LADHGICGPGRCHAHRYTQGIRRVRPPVGEIAYEDHFPVLGRYDSDRPVTAVIAPYNAIAELGQKSLELIGAAMNVADDVEGTMIIALVCPEGLTRDYGGFDALDTGKLPDRTETLALKATETSAHFRHHPLHHLHSKSAVRPRLVTLDANVDTGIKHNGDGQGVPLPSQRDPALTIRRAHIGGVDNSQLPVFQPLAGDLAYQVERIAGDV